MKLGNSSSAPLPVGGPEFYGVLGAVASEVGRSRFYRDLRGFLAESFGAIFASSCAMQDFRRPISS